MTNHHQSGSWKLAFETALLVLERGWISIDQLRCANAWRLTHRPLIGKLALNKGKLTMAQVFTILGEQDRTGKVFGETAVDLGYLSHGEVYELLLDQAGNTPSLVDSLMAQGVMTEEQALFVSKQAVELVVHAGAEDGLVEAA